jgi:hypothetical protein
MYKVIKLFDFLKSPSLSQHSGKLSNLVISDTTRHRRATYRSQKPDVQIIIDAGQGTVILDNAISRAETNDFHL